MKPEAKAWHWEKLGRLLSPDSAISWMATVTGSACALPLESSSLCDIFLTGRDAGNRSLIGRIRIDMQAPLKILEIESRPVFSCGDLGMFDENGVSYPCVLRVGSEVWLYYTGWMPTVLTPFQNHLGLAKRRADGLFERVSRAPILDRTDGDPLSIGSAWVLREGERWRMWYTSFRSWGKTPSEPKHRYLIKYAESADGLHWRREDRVCIDYQDRAEHSICRPTVLRQGETYHMWFCARGEQYRIGYAHSADGIRWVRDDARAGISLSAEGWDSQAQSYPSVFRVQDSVFMLYCGNDYGRSGLGLARLNNRL